MFAISEFYEGCQLKNSRVDRCMTKEQVAFKFHECPDGNEMDNQGKKLISINYHYNL